MNTLTNIYSTALEAKATSIKIEGSERKLFSTNTPETISFNIDGQWVRQQALEKELNGNAFKNTISAITNNISISKSETKEKVFFEKAMSLDSVALSVTRLNKNLIIELDSNKEETSEDDSILYFAKAA
ncbi:hypothetical protein [Billgrantia endophytica]|uniref:hypothetical protein n=1 Tax=Billgrantia endophytica TaxID=2033802 RepID=UPI001054C875|nr:hypothetical protein [Halomonas endophytica]